MYATTTITTTTKWEGKSVAASNVHYYFALGKCSSVMRHDTGSWEEAAMCCVVHCTCMFVHLVSVAMSTLWKVPSISEPS